MGFFSSADVQTIQETLRRQKRHLELMKDDKFRSSKGIERIGAFDFSEIYVLMHIDSPKTKYGEVVDSIIGNTKKCYVFPIPWVWEFIEFMREKATLMKTHFQKESVRKFLSSIPQTTDVGEFQKAYIEAGGMDYYMQLIFQKGIGFLVDEPISKLIRLCNEGKIIGLEKIVDVDDLRIDPLVYSLVFSVLKGMRDRDTDVLANKFDAYAFALIYRLNQKYKNRYYFYIVTHSPKPFTAFKTVTWQEDPLHQGLPLVRHPIYQLEMIRIDNNIADGADQVQFIKDGIQLIDHLIEDVEEIEKLERMLGKVTDPRKRATIRKELLQRIGRFRTYDEQYWSKIFLPVQKDVKAIEESMSYEIVVKDAYTGFLRNAGPEIDAEVAYERIRSKVTELYERALKDSNFDPSKIDPRLKTTLRWVKGGHS